MKQLAPDISNSGAGRKDIITWTNEVAIGVRKHNYDSEL
jgi:hypothetical protein